MNKKAGIETNTLSFTRILATTPKNINNANPPEEIKRMGVETNPTSSPTAPTISKIAVSVPNFSSPKRLNSFFMWGEKK